VPRRIDQDSNRIIEEQLGQRLDTIQTALQADVLTYMGPILEPIHDVLKDAVEEMRQEKGAPSKRRAKIAVILETGGGYIEAAERIANLFRYHYGRVEFVVPDFAMSAGTILVMSGDAIHMDYSSILGPIDPQLQRPGASGLVPALGYLEQYQRLIDKDADGKLTTAEMTYLVQRFDPGELYQYEQQKKLSIQLLMDWLVQYKFKDWKVTESKKERVTVAKRRQRAKEIAEALNDTDRWHSHSRGIPMEVLKRDLNLKIDDLGANPTLSVALRDYHRLIRDYMARRSHNIVWHTRNGHYGV
jgi:membrane-bound ClpP family serine protease